MDTKIALKKLFFVCENDTFDSIAFNADETQIVTCGDPGVCVINIQTGKP